MLKIRVSNSYITNSLQGYSKKMSLLKGVDILKRCSSYRVSLYTIKRSLAKLNIKHRICCNKPIDYKMLTKFFWTSLPDCMGKEVTPIYWHIGCAIFFATQFWLENKNLWVYFLACD